MKKLLPVLFAALVLPTLSLVAQERAGTSNARTLDTELRLQGWRFENFFQASDPAAEQDINAVGAEARIASSVRTGWTPYARVNYLKYDDEGLDATYGGRVGASFESRPHAFDAYVDHQLDRPTFDIGDVFDRADVTTVSGEYKNRFTDDWEAGVEAQFQQQSFQELTVKDNEYTGYGANIRYRGFGSILSPEIGFMMGEREVDDPTETYDQDETYVQLRSAPTDSVYLSLRYRMRQREYTTGDAASSNFEREDDRNQWTLSADWKMLPSLTWNLYYANEAADSSREGRDFDTKVYLLGVTLGF